MQPKKFVLMMLSSVLLLALVLSAVARPASPGAAAGPVAVSSECYTVFLPIIIKASGDTTSSNIANTAPTNALADPCVAASDITENMKLAAAKAIAESVTDEQLCETFIMPPVFDKSVSQRVAAAVAAAAIADGVTR